MLPIARGALEPVEKAQSVLVLREPAIELRPCPQQRLVCDFHRLASARVAVGDQQAKVDEGLEQRAGCWREVGDKGAPTRAHAVGIHAHEPGHESLAQGLELVGRTPGRRQRVIGGRAHRTLEPSETLVFLAAEQAIDASGGVAPEPVERK